MSAKAWNNAAKIGQRYRYHPERDFARAPKSEIAFRIDGHDQRRAILVRRFSALELDSGQRKL